jgi:DNA polymerase-3 subunit gamma/tau
MGGHYRIYVIDEVHMLSKSAFNALLKTLEEPPPKVIFIFATTEPQKIPATIQSRCQRYDFRRISTEHIVGQLAKICADEKIPFDNQALTLVGRKADGSMRDALSLLDQVYSYSQERIGEKEVRSVLGLVDVEVYDVIIEAIKAKNPGPVLHAVQDALFRGIDLQELIIGFEEYLRTLLFSSIPHVLDNPRIELSAETNHNWNERASGLSERTLLRMAEIIRKAEQELKWSAFPRFTVEIALLKLVYMDSTVSVEQLLMAFKEKAAPMQGATPTNGSIKQTDEKKKIDVAPACGEAGETMDPRETRDISAANEPTAPAGAGNAGDPLSQWPEFLELLQRERPMLGYYLRVAYATAHSANSVDVRFPHSCHVQYSEVMKKKNREEINRVMKEFTGALEDLHITIEADPNPAGSAANQAKAAAIPLSINDEIKREPVIQNILDIFNGDILD